MMTRVHACARVLAVADTPRRSRSRWYIHYLGESTKKTESSLPTVAVSSPPAAVERPYLSTLGVRAEIDALRLSD